MTGRRAFCSWCKVWHDGCVLVGVIERASAAAHPLYACRGCRAARRFVAFADHPADTDGTPRTAPWRIRV